MTNHSVNIFRWWFWSLFHWLVVICEYPKQFTRIGLSRKGIGCGQRRTKRGGWGLQPPPPPRNVQITIFGQQKNHVIFGKKHLIFGQAMEKIFGQLTSAPLNETGPVRLWLWRVASAPPPPPPPPVVSKGCVESGTFNKRTHSRQPGVGLLSKGCVE